MSVSQALAAHCMQHFISAAAAAAPCHLSPLPFPLQRMQRAHKFTQLWLMAVARCRSVVAMCQHFIIACALKHSWKPFAQSSVPSNPHYWKSFRNRNIRRCRCAYSQAYMKSRYLLLIEDKTEGETATTNSFDGHSSLAVPPFNGSRCCHLFMLQNCVCNWKSQQLLGFLSVSTCSGNWFVSFVWMRNCSSNDELWLLAIATHSIFARIQNRADGNVRASFPEVAWLRILCTSLAYLAVNCSMGPSESSKWTLNFRITPMYVI